MPFAGCPNRCSFCDQHTITGQVSKTTPQDVIDAVSTAITSGGINAKNSEIAFFGGSFTAIDRDYMISLLEAARPFADEFSGIRISTRPDCIDNEILDFLSQYKVTTIELGAQSMNDDVLRLNNRGHNSDCVRTASQLIKSRGFSLGLQMMTGLYGSSDDLDLYTATEFVKLSPDCVRIYPTVVLEGTQLAQLVASSQYSPQNYESASLLCAKLITMFESAGIDVIRVGLHSSDVLENKIVAGAYHPAFRELCESRIFSDLIHKEISDKGIGKGKISISASPCAISKVTGQKKSNLTALESEGYTACVVADKSLSGRQIIIQEG